jgi:hypothetical protein
LSREREYAANRGRAAVQSTSNTPERAAVIRMSPQRKIGKLSANLASVALVGCCGCGGGHQYSYQDVSVTLSPAVQSVMVNGTQTFTATTSNAPDLPVWFLNNVDGGTPDAGTIATATTDAPTMTYTAPTTPPIYTAAEVANGAVQGSVTVLAFIHSSTTNVLTTVSATQSFVITAPSVTVGLSPATASVDLSSTQQFAAYAVGSLNNALTWQVNGVAGGSATTGIITTAGLYTAPAVLPVSGRTVTVAAVSQADPTRSAACVVTLVSP